jgi:hypothetical protein
MVKGSSFKLSIKTPTPKKGKSKHGAPSKTISLSNYTKNTLKSGRLSLPLWETAMKISVSTDTEGFLSSESTEKSGLLRRMKP